MLLTDNETRVDLLNNEPLAGWLSWWSSERGS